MQVGTLIRYCGDIGIVTDHWTHDVSNELHTVVTWLTGRYEGQTDAFFYIDELEVICK